MNLIYDGIMDELLIEFITESSENLAKLDTELVELEHNPENPEILNSIFRTMHTIKGTCGFIGLPRLEKLAHASESVLVKIRDKALFINEDIISIILQSIDGVKHIINKLSETGGEPDGNDHEIIDRLNAILDVSLADNSKKNESEKEQTADLIDFDAIEVPETKAETEAATPKMESTQQTEQPTPENDTASGEKAPSNDQNQTIRVNINTLENLINTVSELVLTRNQLMQLAGKEENPALNMPLYRLNYVTSELQELVMKTRMQPIGNAWLKLPRIVRDSAKELKKKIKLELHGAETELDRQVIELIKDPLTHMIRNAMDHGLELPDQRIAQGKPEKGTIRMNAYHAGGHIIIEISDDGRGIDAEKIRNKAIEKGLIFSEEANKLNDNQIYQFIFKSGFSTAEKVTNISGRGVGMDVVRTNVEKIGGTIDIKSQKNKGSTFSIKIPLTLSIISALIAESSEYRFAIPQINILELVHISENSNNKIEYINTHPVLRLRNKLIPLAFASDLLGLERTAADDHKHYIIVLQVGNSYFGIIVDKVYNTQEIVVKPVSSLIRSLSIFAGNTILGDGGVISILDPNHMANALSNINLENIESTSQNNDDNLCKEKNIESFLLFLAQDKTPKAIPLSTLTRLEQINLQDVEYADNHPCIQYRDSLMSLIFMTSSTNEDITKPVLVFANHTHTLGLVVDEILDIVENDCIELNLDSHDPTKLGTIILKDRATEILNTDHYLQSSFSDWYAPMNESSYEKMIFAYIGDHFYGSNFLVPFLKIDGFQVVMLTNQAELQKFLVSNHCVNGLILDLNSPVTLDNLTHIKKQENLENLPKLLLKNREDEIIEDSPAGISVEKLNRAGILSELNEIRTKYRSLS